MSNLSSSLIQGWRRRRIIQVNEMLGIISPKILFQVTISITNKTMGDIERKKKRRIMKRVRERKKKTTYI